MHAYIWDLDRTYLATDIRSVRGMVRAAFEQASDKRTIPGAPELLRVLLEHDPAASATVVSGSPTQLRAVLEEKLRLDGITFESLILKDNLRNLRRGRLRALRGQVGYKLPQLLAQRLTRPVQATESLFGDDAEVDALIYTVYAEVIAGRVGEAELAVLLREGGAYDDQVEHAVRSLQRLRPADAVRDIFIHVDRALPLSLFALLGRRVHVVFSWFQAALVLFAAGRLSPAGVDGVIRACVHDDQLSREELTALLQDAVRRALITAEVALEATSLCPALAPHAERIGRALQQLGATPDHQPPPAERDWIGFLRHAESDALAGREQRR